MSKPLSIAIIGGGTSPLRPSRALGHTRARAPSWLETNHLALRSDIDQSDIGIAGLALAVGIIKQIEEGANIHLQIYEQAVGHSGDCESLR